MFQKIGRKRSGIIDIIVRWPRAGTWIVDLFWIYFLSCFRFSHYGGFLSEKRLRMAVVMKISQIFYFSCRNPRLLLNFFELRSIFLKKPLKKTLRNSYSTILWAAIRKCIIFRVNNSFFHPFTDIPLRSTFQGHKLLFY